MNKPSCGLSNNFCMVLEIHDLFFCLVIWRCAFTPQYNMFCWLFLVFSIKGLSVNLPLSAHHEIWQIYWMLFWFYEFRTGFISLHVYKGQYNSDEFTGLLLCTLLKWVFVSSWQPAYLMMLLSTDMHIPGMLVGLISFWADFLRHGLRVDISCMHLAHIDVVYLVMLTSFFSVMPWLPLIVYWMTGGSVWHAIVWFHLLGPGACCWFWDKAVLCLKLHYIIGCVQFLSICHLID